MRDEGKVSQLMNDPFFILLIAAWPHNADVLFFPLILVNDTEPGNKVSSRLCESCLKNRNGYRARVNRT